MARRQSPTENKNSAIERDRRQIRRRYNKDLNKKRKILPGQNEFVLDQVIILKLVNYSNSQIAKFVGISRGQIKEILAQPDVAERLVALRAALTDGTLNLIQTFMIEAVMSIVHVMRLSEDDAVILKAAADLLDRGGVPKSSRSESQGHVVNENRTVFTADEEMMQRLQSLPPEKQEEAAQMIENLEAFLMGQAEETADETDEVADESS
jgi:hypothetical protein